jgi:hypothetical protein
MKKAVSVTKNSLTIQSDSSPSSLGWQVLATRNPGFASKPRGPYSIALAEFLAGQGFPVSVINPSKVHAFATSELSRAKTDKADAKLIARWAARMGADLSAWNPPQRTPGITAQRRGFAKNPADGTNRLDTAVQPSSIRFRWFWTPWKGNWTPHANASKITSATILN